MTAISAMILVAIPLLVLPPKINVFLPPEIAPAILPILGDLRATVHGNNVRRCTGQVRPLGQTLHLPHVLDRASDFHRRDRRGQSAPPALSLFWFGFRFC